jgi:hypothetical protein
VVYCLPDHCYDAGSVTSLGPQLLGSETKVTALPGRTILGMETECFRLEVGEQSGEECHLPDGVLMYGAGDSAANVVSALEFTLLPGRVAVGPDRSPATLIATSLERTVDPGELDDPLPLERLP